MARAVGPLSHFNWPGRRAARPPLTAMSTHHTPAAAGAAPRFAGGDARDDRAFCAWFAALPADAGVVRFFDRKV